MKKALLLLLVASLSIEAKAYDAEIDSICYKFSGEEAVLTGRLPWRFQRDAYEGAVVIPEFVTYEGKNYRVTGIDKNAFWCCSTLTSITIPKSVTSIGKDAFSGCEGLNSIIVEEGNPVYDSRGGCNAIIETKNNKLLYGCNNTVIPNGVKSIGRWALAGYSNLTSITIPESVKKIGRFAFEGCHFASDSLVNKSSVKIKNNGLTLSSDRETSEGLLITGNTLVRCRPWVTSVTIPEGITSIGAGAFWGCVNLTSVSIPNGVTTIGDNAFHGCDGLTSITLPDGLNYIGESAFLYCNSLESVMIPNGVRKIGGNAFRGCRSLTSITIPEGVKWINFGTFMDCSALTTVIIPESVKRILIYAFNDCKSLKNVYCYAAKPPYTFAESFQQSLMDSVTIHVPAASVYDYKQAKNWKNSGKIVAIK